MIDNDAILERKISCNLQDSATHGHVRNEVGQCVMGPNVLIKFASARDKRQPDKRLSQLDQIQTTEEEKNNNNDQNAQAAAPQKDAPAQRI